MNEFSLIETGWAHRDLWVDNLLFHKHCVSAVLDFDRLKYDYPKLDIARAVLSCALTEDTLDVDLVCACIQGYQEHQSFDLNNLVSALKLLWYMESTWWINENMLQFTGPPARFAKEMIWLSENLKDLEGILS